MSDQAIDFGQRRVLRFKNNEHREQELVRRFFGNLDPGFYVDVGANDPSHNSQTFHLEQLGWQGLVVEPLPEMAEKLRSQRKAVVVQCAVSSEQNSGKQLVLKCAGAHSTLSNVFTAKNVTLDRKHEQFVVCRTLNEVLAGNCVPECFQFLSIDVEGHEPEVLAGFSLEKWRPKLILIEDHLTNLHTHRWLTDRSYRLILRTGHNSWYVPLADSFQFSFVARVQFLRKLYVGWPLRRLKRWLQNLN